MGKRMLVAAVVATVVRVVIASSSPVFDAVLVGIAMLLLVAAWDELTTEDTGRRR